MRRLLISSQENSNFPKDGLIHYWSLNGDSVDLVGSANGIDYGVSYTTGVNRQSARFSSNSYIRIPTNIYLNLWSLSLWYNVTKINDYLGLICYRRGDVDFYGFALVDIQIALYYGSNQINLPIYSSMNTWYHAVFCSNGFEIDWYLNGVYQGTENSFHLYLPNNSYIGHDPISGFDRSFKGRLDEIAIWNRCLSRDEALLLYNQGKGLFYE